MKVGIVQISPSLGDVKKNLEIHLEYIDLAKQKKIDLLIFPELSLTGYLLKDLVEEVAINPETSEIFADLLSASKDINLVFGFIEEKDRGIFYNSSACLSSEKVLHIHRKVFLPTYGMFEEGKLYATGRRFQTFTAPWGKSGMVICYDFLHYSSFYLLFVGGSEVIIAISAAPGRGLTEENAFATCRMWELMGESMSKFSSAFVIYCNRVGMEDGIQFHGGSFIYNPAGELVAKAPYLDEHFLIQELNLEDIRTIRKKIPYKRDEKPEIILQDLQRILSKNED